MAKYDARRYKIDTLLKMAKTTSNEALREKYIAEADIELQYLSEDTLSVQTSSVENFINDCFEYNINERISRDELYDAYIDFCNKNNVTCFSKNILYRSIRNHGFDEIKSNGVRFFKGKIV